MVLDKPMVLNRFVLVVMNEDYIASFYIHMSETIFAIVPLHCMHNGYVSNMGV